MLTIKQLIKVNLLLWLMISAHSCHSFQLLITFYNERNLTRLAEYYYCLMQNVNHPLIEKVHVFYENPPEILPAYFNHPKIQVLPISDRPSFAEFINYANQQLAGKKVIIANTDIFFDDSLFKLNHYPMAQKFMCLTRYNMPQYPGHWERHIESHDAWIFQTPTPVQVPPEIKIGIVGCDVILQRIACTTPGVDSSNPATDIYSWHCHQEDSRRYTFSYRPLLDNYPRIKLPFSKLNDFNLSWGLVANSPQIWLYAGELPSTHPNYTKFVGLSLERNDAYHLLYNVRHRLPLPDNSVAIYQAEDTFAKLPYYCLPEILNEIYRVLKPGGLCRISVPDYRCAIFEQRSLKDEKGQIIFDPAGGGNLENGKVPNGGYVWFPKIETVKKLLTKTLFYSHGTINYLHYHDENNQSVINKIDYTFGYVQQTPDHDPVAKIPPRKAMSIVIDLYKAI